MKIAVKTESYNERRYGKPWIAKVIITAAKPGGDFLWGNWIGDYRNGGEGELLLNNLEAGDIYAQGQKDNRQPRNSSPKYYVVDMMGNAIACRSIVTAKEKSVEIKNKIEEAKNAETTYTDYSI